MKKHAFFLICLLLTVMSAAGCSSETDSGGSQPQTAVSNTADVSDSVALSTVGSTETGTEQTHVTASQTEAAENASDDEASSSISVNEALNALENFFSDDGCYVNGIGQNEDGAYQFSVVKDNSKYADVSVDLSTGVAQITIVSTGEQYHLNLLA